MLNQQQLKLNLGSIMFSSKSSSIELFYLVYVMYLKLIKL